ncbi:MAG TPA: tetratricopeptide repeat protein [Tepidisphaeraceae bacterium]|nr:tetratricopeptide repeat protein [Tepidisphaeraceae bacterium]
MQDEVQRQLQRAVQLHAAGELNEAEKAYRNLLLASPNDPRSTHLLGMVLYQQGNYSAAEPYLKRSLALTPDAPDFHSNYALLCRVMKRADEALNHLQKAIQLDPSYAEAHNNLGLVLDDLKRFDEAAACYAGAIRISPDYFDPQLHLAENLWHRRRFTESIQHLQRLAVRCPNHAGLHNLLCAGLGKTGRMKESIQHGRIAVRLNPNNADARMNLGCALASGGMTDAAVAQFQEALQLSPHHAVTLTNLGWLMRRAGRFEEAAQFCRQALQVNAAYAPALNQLGLISRDMQDIDSAVQYCSQAVRIQPDDPGNWMDLGLANLETGDFKAAAECARRTLSIQPDYAVAHSNLLFSLQYDPDISQSKLFEEHVQFGRIHESGASGSLFTHPNRRDPNRCLRIGYVSPYFRHHAVACFVEPILGAHDRSNFTITCYSDVQTDDEVTQRLKTYGADWRNTAYLSDNELSQLIHADQQDILVDLTGHVSGNRLLAFAQKPAPIQITYLGYQNTTGLRSMDYRLTDEIADPNKEGCEFYTEALIRLPCFFCYQPPAKAPEVAPTPAHSRGYVTFGCLNHAAKLNDRVLKLWARVLDEVKDSKLVLLVTAAGICERRIQDLAQACGVPAQRLKFVRRCVGNEYLSLYSQIDIALDPFPFSGHTTTCDTLWMGVPLVTLRGRSYASRMSASVLTHLGMTEFIAEDADQYVRIACDLAGNPRQLSDLRASMRTKVKNSVITDASSFTKNLESTYRELWSRWCDV